MPSPHSRRITWFLGFAFLAAGLFPLASALGWFAVTLQDIHSPLWTAGCFGAFLLFSGLAIVAPESFTLLRGLLVALALTMETVIFVWIAFGRGEGGFALQLKKLLDALALRENIALETFALFAVLVSLLTLWSWLQWLRELTGRELH